MVSMNTHNNFYAYIYTHTYIHTYIYIEIHTSHHITFDELKLHGADGPSADFTDIHGLEMTLG